MRAVGPIYNQEVKPSLALLALPATVDALTHVLDEWEIKAGFLPAGGVVVAQIAGLTPERVAEIDRREAPTFLLVGDEEAELAGQMLHGNIRDFVTTTHATRDLPALLAPYRRQAVADSMFNPTFKPGDLARTVNTVDDLRAAAVRASATPAPPFTCKPAELRAVIRARHAREKFFGPLFADPAWDMLLDLTVSFLEYRRVSVTSLCVAACVPDTTALRWIKNMVTAGLFVRTLDFNDGRRAFIGLSDIAEHAMRHWLAVHPPALGA